MKPITRRSAVALFLPLESLEFRRLLSSGMDATFGVGGSMRFQPTGELDIVGMAPQTGSAFVVLAARPASLARRT